MTRPSRRKVNYTEYRSPKRRKIDPGPTIYATRVVSWEEQLRLPERFHEEQGVWPAIYILDERVVRGEKQFLLEWEPHPETGEIWPPSWEPKQNVGVGLIKAWRKEQGKSTRKNRDPSSRNSEPPPISSPNLSNGITQTTRAGRKRQAHLVIQDSSSDIQSEPGIISDSRTPTLASSPASSAADSFRPRSPAVEILETQQPKEVHTISVNVPTAAIDKSDYSSVRSSQYSIPDPASFDLSSPLAESITGSSSRTLRSTGRSNQQSTQSPLSHRDSSRLSLAHKILYQAVGSQAPFTSRHIDVPRSSAGSRPLNAIQSSSISPGALIHESNATSASRISPLSISKDSSHSRVQESGLSRKSSQSLSSLQSLQSQISQSNYTGQPLLQSSAQLVAPGSASYSGTPVPLQSIGPVSQLSESSTPWAFESHLPYQSDSSSQVESSPGYNFNPSQPKKKLFQTFRPSRLQVGFTSSESLHSTPQRPSKIFDTKMSGLVPRQSPRPRPATPASSVRSPQPAIRERVRRTRTQDSSPSMNDAAVSSNVLHTQTSQANASSDELRDQPSTSRPASSFNLMQVDEPEAGLASGMATPASIYDAAIGNSALPIQQSIEDEPPSSAEEHNSIASKASSSQQSLENERVIPQIDGVTLPMHPILGPAEYTIALPAEGKVQSTYMDTIKFKRKTLLKFIRRRDSVGSAPGSTTRTLERNEMIELIQRLHDTTTHLDLGLPGFSTQYSVRSEEHTAYANYAGSKFAFLGHLIDVLSRVDCSVVIATQSGPVQDLLEEYLTMRHVSVRRHDRPASPKPRQPDPSQVLVKVDLVSTAPNGELYTSQRPILIIAFDASFDNQELQINRIRELNSRGRDQLLPVVHLLVTNSSEHIDRCLRKSMPSPQRLKLLIRGTYQARKFLGGSPSYVPHPSDEPEGRPMDLSDLQKAVRKSPDRKLAMVANILARAAVSGDFDNHWNLSDMPEVQYEDLEDNTPKTSESSTAAHTTAPTPRDGRARSRTPISRAGTPSGKKRFLDVEGNSPSLIKRQRLTPFRDIPPSVENAREHLSKLEQFRQTLRSMQTELATEKDARKKAEEARDYTKKRLDEFSTSLADLQRRYEKRMKKCHEQEKTNNALLATIDSGKSRQEKTAKDNIVLKGQIGQLQIDLAAARTDLKAGGGDVAALELAREEARTSAAKSQALEKSLENTKRDFEFTRQQYQQASNKAAELGGQNAELEAQIAELKVLAGDEKRRLKEMNSDASNAKHLEKIAELELEKRGQLTLLRKMEDEIKVLKKSRGVQTRGSSVQPGSPGPRSRQGSPAPGMLVPPSAHTGNRASVLRHER